MEIVIPNKERSAIHQFQEALEDGGWSPRSITTLFREQKITQTTQTIRD
jgi:hypothetical protein